MNDTYEYKQNLTDIDKDDMRYQFKGHDNERKQCKE